MHNKKNNKGFSLVELIVVIAVMAVLVGVLAPAYLRYVEKSREQKDISAVAEVVQSIKIAAANEGVSKEVSEGFTVTVENNAVPTAEGDDVDSINEELKATIGTVKLSSEKIGTGAEIEVSKTNDGALKLDVTCKNAEYSTALDSLDEN